MSLKPNSNVFKIPLRDLNRLVMHHIMMFWSVMDHIYNGGPIRS